MDPIQELLNRGDTEEVIDKKHLEERLKKGDKLRVKLGIDPTSPNIHIGRAVVLWKLRKFQDLGHQAIFIVGDFTGLVGDASDKESERPMLDESEVKENMKTYFEQAYKILDKDKTEVYYNSEWLKKLGFIEIAKMASLFSLHEFESREIIAKRMKEEKRVSFHELMYPLMQGYDSVAVRADVELGGTDQRFNLLAGRTIQPLYNQSPQDILMTKILEGTDGRKMSSSWGNVINITDEPKDMFGKVMRISDDLIMNYVRLATNMETDELKAFKSKLEEISNPMEIKKDLALKIVSMYYGDEVAKKERSEFERVFSKRETPEDLKVTELSENNKNIVMFLSEWLKVSKSEAKRLIDQKAVSINGKEVDNWESELKKGDIVRSGPINFIKIK